MSVKGIHLAWIVVNDLKKAIKYYELLGLKLLELNEGFGWAEMGTAEGTRLGLAGANIEEGVKPGSNAILTMSVENIKETINQLKAKGVKFVGELIEIPGIVKMQYFEDADGNRMQLVESGEGHG